MADPIDTSWAVDEYLNSPAQLGARARFTMSTAVSTQPDLEAELRKVAARTGVPVDTVRAYPDEMKRQATLGAYDFDKLASEFPNTSRFLADPDKAAVGHDESGFLSTVEGMAKFFVSAPGTTRNLANGAEYLGKSIHSGLLSLTGTAATLANNIFGTSEADLATLYKKDPIGLQDMLDNSPATAAIRFARSQQQGSENAIAALSPGAMAQYGSLKYATLDPNESALLSPIKVLGDALQSLPSSAAMGLSIYLTKGASTQATAEALAAGLTPQAAKAAGILAAEHTMARLGASSEGIVGYGQQYNQTREGAEKVSDKTLATSKAYKDLLTEGYTPSTARTLVSANAAEQSAQIAGIVDAAVNFVGGKFLGRIIGEGGAPIRAAGKGGFTEAVTEGVQSPGEQFGQNLAMQQNMDPTQDLSEGVLENMVQGAAVGGLTGGVMAGVSAVGSRHTQQIESAKVAEENANVLETMQKTAEASKLLERSPDTLRTFMQGLADEGVPQVFVDSSELVKAGVDMQALAQAVPSIAAQMKQIETGGDLVIPTGELLVNTAGSEFSQALMDHARTSEGAMSRAKAKVYMQEHGDLVYAEIDRVMAEKENDAEFKAGRDVVQGQILAQLNEVKRFMPQVNEKFANLAANYYAVMAARSGMTVEKFADTYKLGFTGNTESGARVLEQGGRSADDYQPGVLKFDTQSAFEKYGGIGDVDESTDIEPKSQAFADMAEAAGYKVAGRGDKYVVITKPFGKTDDGYDVEVAIKVRISDHSNINQGLHFKDTDINLAPDDGYQRDTFEDALRKINSAYVDKNFNTVIPNDPIAPDSNNPNILHQGEVRSSQSPYEHDIFGNPLPAPAGKAGSAARRTKAKDGDVQPAGAIQDTQAPPGEYHVRTVVGSETNRKLGASQITTASELAQATAYLYRSAVERFDGIVTDSAGKPLGVVGGFKGAIAQTSVHPGTIVAEAVRIPGAAHVWFSHNHPSGISQLSKADMDLTRVLVDVFNGSGIRPMGLMAVAGNEFSFTTNGLGVLDQRQSFDAPTTEVSVPVIEREMVARKGELVLVKSPNDAKRIAAEYYAQAKGPGIILLTTQNDVAAWVPLQPEMLGQLRDTGGLNAIYRAISESNSAAAIIVHGGELSEKGDLPSGTISANIAAALGRADVLTLDSINAVTMESAAEQGKNLIATTLFQENRAQIAFADDITKQASIISLFKKANFSSFIHEGGHFFLEVQADLAARISARVAQGEAVTPGEQSIVDDMDKLLDWMGVKGSPGQSALGVWLAMPLEEKRGSHEMFARGFEAYVFEGKAPSLDLQKTFQTFRAWLVNVYRAMLKSVNASKTDIGKALDVELTPEVRSVMDRMLATSDMIAEAEAARNMGPLFETAESAGMTADEYKDYHDKGVQATMDAVDELQGKGLRDMQWLQNARSRKLKEMQGKHDALRREISMQARREVMAQPIYRAWTFLTANHDMKAASVEAPLDMGAGKLRTQALRDMYGTADDAIWRKVSALRMTSDEVGLDPDVVAALFRNEDDTPAFTSGDHLVRTLIETTPPAAVIEQMTDQRMLEDHGDLATPAGLERAANQAVSNDARARFVATELEALHKAMSVREKVPGQRNTVDVLVRAARNYADEIIARLKVRDIRPGQYVAAEVRSSKAAAKAVGDLAQATLHKRNQLINMYAAKAAYAAQDEVAAAVKYFKKFDTARKSIDPDYQDQIDGLLEAFDFKPASLKAIDKRQSFAAWYAEQAKDGLEPDVPDSLLALSAKQSYKDMTVEELRGLVDTVKQIEHLGRFKNELMLAHGKRELDAAVGDMVERVNASKDSRVTPREGESRLRDTGAGFLAMMRKFSSYMRQMDGTDDGPLFNALVRTANERGVAEDLALHATVEKLMPLYDPLRKLPGGLHGDMRVIPGTSESLSRGGRLALLLNFGNEENRQRIEAGDGWGVTQIQGVAAMMTPLELNFVNEIWAYLDTFWPAVAALERKVRGTEPKKVEAIPFTVTASDGTQVAMRGGYYPISYAPSLDAKAAVHETSAALTEAARGASLQAMTRRGHAKERTANVKRRVRLDLGVITNHVQQVVHDLSWREWVIDANKVLRHKDFSAAVFDRYGRRVYEELVDHVQSVAVGDAGPRDAVDKTLFWARNNTSRAVMGFSLTTSFLQPFGLLQAMQRIGVKPVLIGMKRWIGDAVQLESTTRWIYEKSPMMAGRGNTFSREIRELSNAVEGKSQALVAFDTALFYMIQRAQMVADIPSWIGQYEKTLAEGPTENTDESRQALEAKAIAQADRAVIEGQGAGEIKDMAKVQRKHPMMTMFYSYFSATWQLVAESTHETNFRHPKAVAGWLGDMMLLVVLPAIGPAVLMAMLRGIGGGDDEEKLAKIALKEQVGYLLNMLPLVREFSGIVSGFDYRGPPVGMVVGEAFKAYKQTAQGEIDEPFILAYARVLSLVFGLPVTQVLRSYNGWKAWDEGKDGAGPQSLLFGPPLKD